MSYEKNTKNAKLEDIKVYSSGVFVVLLVCIAIFYAYNVVPEENMSVINMIVGSLLTMGVLASKRIFGDASQVEDEARQKIAAAEQRILDAETRAARQIEKISAALDVFEAKYNTLKETHDTVMQMLVDRHVVLGQGVDLVPGNRQN